MRKAIFCLFFAGTFYAQQVMDNRNVVELLRNGASPAEVCRIVRTAPAASFNLMPESMNALTAAGVPPEVIKAMSARQLRGPVKESDLPALPAKPEPVRKAAHPESAETAMRTPESTQQPAAPARPVDPSALWAPRVDLFGGYSYVSADSNGLGRYGANGWESSASLHFNRWLGVESDFGAYYRSFPDLSEATAINARDYSFGGGPRINYGPFFFHTLFGLDRLSGSAIIPGVGSLGVAQNSMATFLGGGVQFRIPHSRFAVRVSADYVITQHNIYGFAGAVQNNIRISTGIVYTAGGSPQSSW